MIISSKCELITLKPDRQLCSGIKEPQDKNGPANSRLKVTRMRRAIIQKINFMIERITSIQQHSADIHIQIIHIFRNNKR